MKPLHYIVRIYERPTYPVVTHVFTGISKDEVMGYFNAHLQSDSFLASVFSGNAPGTRFTVSWVESDDDLGNNV